MTTQQITGRNVYIIDGVRTPFLKARGIGPFSATELGLYAARELLLRMPFAASELDEVIAGCMVPREDEANIARIIALRLGCGHYMPAWTVQRNCASGMQALDCAFKDIASGRHDLVLAGGTEAMSHAPLIYKNKAVHWFAGLMRSKTKLQRLKQLTRLPLMSLLNPTVALICGLTDPVVGLGMGQTAEVLANKFAITRETMDQFACQSHQRLAAAFDEGRMDEVIPIYDKNGQAYEVDTGLRRDTTMENLAKLKPIFDRNYGHVTAGNSSQVTDGACFLMLASEDAVKKYNLPIVAEIKDAQWAACNPAEMGLGPVYATTPLLQRQQLAIDAVDYWEINEAFAAQVLACIAAWQDDQFCRDELGLASALGELDQSRLNIDGGAVAAGHPVGASGARIVLRLIKTLRRQQAKRGIAAICVGGGQGGAMLIENVSTR
ncbi:MAG: acetyl-CoA C-acetyltransferase [Pseudomonadota bacterium]